MVPETVNKIILVLVSHTWLRREGESEEGWNGEKEKEVRKERKRREVGR